MSVTGAATGVGFWVAGTGFLALGWARWAAARLDAETRFCAPQCAVETSEIEVTAQIAIKETSFIARFSLHTL
jgi:hypothetical protein